MRARARGASAQGGCWAWLQCRLECNARRHPGRGPGRDAGARSNERTPGRRACCCAPAGSCDEWENEKDSASSDSEPTWDSGEPLRPLPPVSLPDSLPDTDDWLPRGGLVAATSARRGARMPKPPSHVSSCGALFQRPMAAAAAEPGRGRVELVLNLLLRGETQDAPKRGDEASPPDILDTSLFARARAGEARSALTERRISR